MENLDVTAPPWIDLRTVRSRSANPSRLPFGVSGDDLKASFSSGSLIPSVVCPAHDMNLSTPDLSAELFRELSHLSDGDFVIYLRNDPSNFSEIHRTGDCYPFTSTLSAFIPELVIQLHSPLVSSIVTAV